MNRARLRYWCLTGLAALAWSPPAAAQPADKPHFYKGVEVVCVGIDRHRSRGVRDLQQAEKDARDVAHLFETQYGFAPKLLLNKEASRRDILAALDELDARPAPPEAVVLYFACHGAVFEYPDPNSPAPVRVGFLIPYDADVDLQEDKPKRSPEEARRWAEEAIGMRWLADRVGRMKARHVVLIADACCSGFLTKRGLRATPDLVALIGDPSRTVLAATTQWEGALEGVFTKELLGILGRAAKDRDPLTVTDVFQDLRRGVGRNPAGARMTPQMAHLGDGDGEFVFIPSAITPAEVEKLAEAVEKSRAGKPPADIGKLVTFRGLLEREQKRQARQSRLADVAAALEAEDYRYSANPEAEAGRWEGAARTFAENAALGDPWAMAGLHFCAARGLGGEASPAAAYFWARQADQFEKPAGLGKYLLARCYERGLGVPKNEVAAEKVYAAAADAGLPLALLRRGTQVSDRVKPTGPPLPPGERAAAEKDLRAAYDAGITVASVPLFRFYVLDPSSDLKANAPVIEMLEKAAGQNSAYAHEVLWLVYAKGGMNLPPKDLTRAKEHLFKGAELGRAYCQRLLAIEYFRKQPWVPLSDLKQDFKQVRHWADLAARQDDPGAHYLLALLARNGDGMAVDHDKYRTHLDDAARLKYPAAMNDLFWELCRGKVYRQDFARALQTAEESAGLGHADGHYNLGYYYLALLNPDTGKVALREGVETFLFNDHANTYRTLHHYWQAYKTAKHPGAKRFLDNYWESHVKNPNSLEVDADLRKHYPETAKELFAATDFGKKK